MQKSTFDHQKNKFTYNLKVWRPEALVSSSLNNYFGHFYGLAGSADFKYCLYVQWDTLPHCAFFMCFSVKIHQLCWCK